MAASGTNLLVGGRIFDRTFGPGVSRWDGGKWNKMGNGISISDYGPYLFALAVKGTDVYAGGSIFYPSGGGVLRWDGSNWAGLGGGVWNVDCGGPGGCLDSLAYALAVKGDVLYAGGRFEMAGDVSAHNLAKWDGTNWSAVDDQFFGPEAFGVTALGVHGNDLYLAIESATYSTMKWDGSNFVTLGITDGRVHTFAFSGNDVYIGGRFQSVNGIPASNVARWDGTNWFALGSGIGGTDGSVWSILIWKGDVIAGGLFETAGGKASKNFAIWHPVALHGAALHGNLQLSWPAFATNYVLESNSGLGPEGWATVSPPPQTNGYTVPVSGGSQFFRLRQQ
jgi:hypothetical protein